MPELLKSMSEEDAAMEEQRVFEYCTEDEVPSDRTIKPSQYIHSVKSLPNGDEKYKSRLVGGGHRQIADIDFEEVFASVVRKQTLRLLVAIAAILLLIIYHADCNTAYLNADMDIVNYVRLPNGRIVKLLKALYGMKQSGRQWQILLRETMKLLGFTQLASDQCVYQSKDKHNNAIIVAIYVDDLYIFCKNVETAEAFCDKLAESFKLKKLGIATNILGMQIEYTSEHIIMHQEKYIVEMLEKFKMSDCKSVSTPILSGSESGSKSDLTTHLYMQVIGSLLHLSNSTRPDIAYAISILAAKMQSPTVSDWQKAKRLFRYLKGTKSHALHCEKNTGKLNIDVYSDADHANCTETRRSRTGIVISVSGFPITWQSKRQTLVTVSTVESEYVAASSACQELIWILSVLKELKIEYNQPVMHMDNQGSIAIAKDPVHHGRTKHIDIRYHYIREKYREKLFEMIYCPTKEQLADIFTKALPQSTFEYLLKRFNLANRTIKTEPDLRGSVELAVSRRPRT